MSCQRPRIRRPSTSKRSMRRGSRNRRTSRIIVSGYVVSTGIDASNDRLAMIRTAGGSHIAIAREGQSAPGAGSTAIYSDPESIEINDSLRVALTARVRNGVSGTDRINTQVQVGGVNYYTRKKYKNANESTSVTVVHISSAAYGNSLVKEVSTPARDGGAQRVSRIFYKRA